MEGWPKRVGEAPSWREENDDDRCAEETPLTHCQKVCWIVDAMSCVV